MILISSCLAGIPTRYDGKDSFVESLEQLVSDGQAMLVCPEQLGGLPTPRNPAEIVGGDGFDVLDGKARVVDSENIDVTEMFLHGAEQTLKIAKKIGALKVVLKENSPSCGSAHIYNGCFDGTKKQGVGVTAALLIRSGIKVSSELNFKEEY